MFSNKKPGEGATPPNKRGTGLYVTSTTDENGNQSQAEVLPRADQGGTGLFVRPVIDVTDASVKPGAEDQAVHVRLTPTADTAALGASTRLDGGSASRRPVASAVAPKKKSLVDRFFKSKAPKTPKVAKAQVSEPKPSVRVEPTAPSVGEPVVVEAPAKETPVVQGAERKSFFGRKKPKAQAAAFEGSGKKASKQPKQPKTAKNGVKAKSAKNLFLQVRLEGDRLVHYVVTADGLTQIAEDDVASTITTGAASFSSADYRFAVPAETSLQRAVDLALQEGVGDDVRVLNHAKTMGCFYAAALDRLHESPVNIGPGLKLVELAVGRKGRPQGQHVICLLLKDGDSGRALAVLYHQTKDGEIADMQVTVNPQNLDFTFAQYSSTHNLADQPVVQLDNADLLAVAGELELFYRDEMWRGVPLLKLLWGAVLVAGVAAAAAGGYAGYQYVQLKSSLAEASKHRATTASFDKRNQALISGSLMQFGKHLSLDVDRLRDRAADVWVPRSTISFDTTARNEEYLVKMKMSGGSNFNNRPSVLTRLEEKNVMQLLSKAPPEGCVKSMPGVAGGVNEIQVKVSCESPVGSTGRYRLD